MNIPGIQFRRMGVFPGVQRFHSLNVIPDIMNHFPGSLILLLLLFIIPMLHARLGAVKIALILQPVIFTHHIHQNTEIDIQANQQYQIYPEQKRHLPVKVNLHQIHQAIDIKHGVHRQQNGNQHLPRRDMPPGLPPCRQSHQQNHHKLRHPGHRHQHNILQLRRVQLQKTCHYPDLKPQNPGNIGQPHRCGQNKIIQHVNLRRFISPSGRQGKQAEKKQIHPGISQHGKTHAHRNIYRYNAQSPPGYAAPAGHFSWLRASLPCYPVSRIEHAPQKKHAAQTGKRHINQEFHAVRPLSRDRYSFSALRNRADFFWDKGTVLPSVSVISYPCIRCTAYRFTTKLL